MSVRKLRPDLEEKSIKNLNEDPERREADLATLRDWLKKQTHILATPDDQTLITFLRGCKFSLEKVKQKLDMYYTIRTNVPEFFKDRNIENNTIVQYLKMGLYLLLPHVDDIGRRVMMIRPGVTTPSKHKIEDQFKANFYLMDMLIREDDDLLINGIVSIIDLSNVTLGHATQMTPTAVKKLMVCAQEGFPIQPKAIHYVHTPPMFETVYNLFKLFAKEKMKKRFFVHGDNMESLYKHVPLRLLPEEYGGKAGPIKHITDSTVKRLESYNDWYISPEGIIGVDESKRPGKPKSQQDLFGLEGSFRQLAVD